MTNGDTASAGAYPHVLQKTGNVWARALAHRTIGPRVIPGEPPGFVTSIANPDPRPRVEDAVRSRPSPEPTADQFTLDGPDARATRWLQQANQARGTAIARGSESIQRHAVAKRVRETPGD